MWEVVAQADALIGMEREAFNAFFTTRLFEVGRRLRWVHAPGAGIEECLIPGFAEATFVMTNGKILQGPEVADHAMALLLALTRNLHVVIAGRGDGMTPRPIELRGKIAVVVGMGGVGLLIAERAAAFGMSILGVTVTNLALLRMVDRVVPPDQLLDVLPQADAVFLAVPLTPASDGLMGPKEFAAMKSSAHFINVSRGRTVQTDALVARLAAGRLAGVGLDVSDPEPLPPDHPLRRFPNVVITPHFAGVSDHNRQRGFEPIKTNLQRFMKGLPLINVVDKAAGY
jgi:phosphoglycerate dehydrogenase-like enzyme